MYPFAGTYDVDKYFQLKTLKELSMKYYIGYEKLRQLLEGEQPCLQLYSQRKLMPDKIKLFTEQLKAHCRDKLDQFEPNEDWSFEKHVFAQKVLTSLRRMNFSDAEDSINEIHEFFSIRNGLYEFDFIQASQFSGNIKFEMQPGDYFEKEQNEWYKDILPLMDKVIVRP